MGWIVQCSPGVYSGPGVESNGRVSDTVGQSELKE